MSVTITGVAVLTVLLLLPNSVKSGEVGEVGDGRGGR